MTDDDPQLSRRTVMEVLLAAGAAGGLASTSSGESTGGGTAAIGGGPVADPIGEYRVQTYAMTWSEFQSTSPGVRDRIVKIQDPGNQHHGEIYYDDGSSWELSDLGVGKLNAERADIGQVVGKIVASSGTQTISTNTITVVAMDTIKIEDTDVVSADLSNNRISINVGGTYRISAMVRWSASSNWSLGDQLIASARANQSIEVSKFWPHNGANEILSPPTASTEIELSDGDNIDMVVRQRRGGDETLDASPTTTQLIVSKTG